MSDRASQRADARTIRQSLDESIESLNKWLGEAASVNSAHADACANERMAWHYGYLIALQDVRALVAAA
jgi:hypothetical protein